MISISLDKPSYKAGDAVIATINIKLGKPTSARGIHATLLCTEKKKVKVDRVMDKYDLDRQRDLGVPVSTHITSVTEERSKTLFKEEKKVAGGNTYVSGEHTVQFVLPSNAVPTSYEYGHDNTMHIWKLSVKLDIPMAIDENAECNIQVDSL